MRVAYLVNQYPHVSHTFIRREITGLEAEGVDVLRFSIRPAGATIADPDDAVERDRTRSLLGGGKRVILRSAVAALFRNPVRWFRAARWAWKLGSAANNRMRHLAYFAEACLLVEWLREGKVDHLHAHFGTNPAAVALLARALGGPPYSFTVHGPEEFDRPEALCLREKAAQAAFVVAISMFGRSQLFRWLHPSDWGKVHIVHCGVDASFLADGPDPVPDVPRLVCVGRLTEQKGQLLLIGAAAGLASEGISFQLVIAGDGPMRREVQAAIQKHDLGDRVRITGWVSGDEVRSEMLAARAVVLGSFAEGLPVVLMEALALGRPVVTTYIAGIPELVRDGENGWLVPAGDMNALATALQAVLATSTDVLTAMGRAGFEAVREAHDSRREARKLARLFAGLFTECHTVAIREEIVA